MSKKILVVLCAMVIIMSKAVIVKADTGPKPSVKIQLAGFEGERFYVTLLSAVSSSGPHRVYHSVEKNEQYKEDDKDYDIWKKFVDYKDSDGFYFLQYFSDCTDTKEFEWGYYPPERFKILIYFPDKDSFAVSQICSQYAFHSYYKVNIKAVKVQNVSSIAIKAVKSYHYAWESISLCIRVLVTIIIETIIGLLFGFRTRKQMGIILVTNIITQTLLNLLLNIFYFYYGNNNIFIYYFCLELFVTVIECIVYYDLLHKYSRRQEGKRRKAIEYGVAANGASFLLGFIIANIVAGIF